jgi:hypothetical protein
MPALKNPRHERFAQAVALNMPASQAYAEYVSGGKCSERTAEVTGSTLANSSEVSLRIAELRSKVSERAEKKFDMTKDKWLDELAAIAKESRETGDFSAATGALREIGKGAAFYAPEKVEHSGTVGLEGLTEAVAAVFRK